MTNTVQYYSSGCPGSYPVTFSARKGTHEGGLQEWKERSSAFNGTKVCGLTVSAVAVTQPGLRALLLASQTGTHGVWNPGR